MQIKQFKLSNGDEVICEVVTWPSDGQEEVIIKKSLKIAVAEDFKENIRYYSFKPWMVFSEDPEMLSSLNPFHIVGEGNPTDELLQNYYETLETLNNNLPESKKFSDAEADLLDKVIDKLHEEIESQSADSEISNVVKFKPKETFH